LETAALNAKLAEEKVDLTLPGVSGRDAAPINPYFIVVDEMTSIFADMGFEVVEGRDVETDHFNFELLNVPKDHPAREICRIPSISTIRRYFYEPRLRRLKPTRCSRKAGTRRSG
jgi:hypothetical protein